jgi:hypothetical protein
MRLRVDGSPSPEITRLCFAGSLEGCSMLRPSFAALVVYKRHI